MPPIKNFYTVKKPLVTHKNMLSIHHNYRLNFIGESIEAMYFFEYMNKKLMEKIVKIVQHVLR